MAKRRSVPVEASNGPEPAVGVAQAAFDAAVRASDPPTLTNNRVTLSNGVVLGVRPVPPLAIRQAVLNVPKPPVPVTFLEDKGREEENPNDPEYLEALAAYRDATGQAALNVLLLMGTKLESLPEGLCGPDGDEWLGDLEFLGLTIDKENPRARYLAWLQFYAIPSNADITRALEGPAKAAGVAEGDVAAAIESFRSPT